MEPRRIDLCGPSELHKKRWERVTKASLPDNLPTEASHGMATEAVDEEGESDRILLLLQKQLLPEHMQVVRMFRTLGLSRKISHDVMKFLPDVRPPCTTLVKTCWSANLELFLCVIPKSLQVVNWQLQHLLSKAWVEDPQCCARLIIRLGERPCWSQLHAYYDAVMWLWEKHPMTLLANLHELPQHGCWVDLCEILVRACEGGELTRARQRAVAYRKASRMKVVTADDGISPFLCGGRLSQAERALSRYHADPMYRALFHGVANLFAAQLLQDLGGLDEPCKFPSPCAKWCPGLGSSYDQRTLLCEGIARRIFPHESSAEYSGMEEAHYAFRIRDRFRREVLAPLRRHLKLPGKKRGPPRTPFPRLSSRATCSLGHNTLSMDQFLQTLKRGKEESMMIFDATLPSFKEKRVADWVCRAMLSSRDQVSDNPPSIGTVVASNVCDSLHECARGLRSEDVAVALAVECSLMSTPFQNCMLFASETPIVDHMPQTMSKDQRFSFCKTRIMNATSSTFSLTRLMQCILEQQNVHCCPQNCAAPVKRLLIVSDVDIVTATGQDVNALQAEVRQMELQYSAGNVPFPEIVFWNLAGDPEYPCVAYLPGLISLSGFSLPLLEAVVTQPAFKLMSATIESLALALSPFRKIWVIRHLAVARKILAELLQGEHIELLAANTPASKLAARPAARPPRRPRPRVSGVDLCLVAKNVSGNNTIFEFYKGLIARFPKIGRLRIATVNEHGQVLPFVEYTSRAFASNAKRGHGGRWLCDFRALDECLQLDWQGSVRLLVWPPFLRFSGLLCENDSDKQGNLPGLNHYARGLMHRVNMLGIRIITFEVLRDLQCSLLERSYRVWDGKILQLPPWRPIPGCCSLQNHISRCLLLPTFQMILFPRPVIRRFRRILLTTTIDLDPVQPVVLQQQSIGSLIGFKGVALAVLKESVAVAVLDEVRNGAHSICAQPGDEADFCDDEPFRGILRSSQARSLGLQIWTDVSTFLPGYVQVTLQGYFHPRDVPVLAVAVRQVGRDWAKKQMSMIPSPASIIQDQLEPVIHIQYSSIRFSQCCISSTFADGKQLKDLVDNLFFGELLLSDIPYIRVCQHKGNFYSLDNRLLAAIWLWSIWCPNAVDSLECRLVPKTSEWKRKFSTRTKGKSIYIIPGCRKLENGAEPLKRRTMCLKACDRNASASVAERSVLTPRLVHCEPGFFVSEKTKHVWQESLWYSWLSSLPLSTLDRRKFFQRRGSKKTEVETENVNFQTVPKNEADARHEDDERFDMPVVQEVSNPVDEAVAVIDPHQASRIVSELWATGVEASISRCSVVATASSNVDAPSIIEESSCSAQKQKIVVLNYGRYPEELDTVLTSSPLGRRLVARGVDLKPSWAQGGKVLVEGLEQGHAEEVRAPLGPWHVFVLAEDEKFVHDALKELPWKQRPTLKPSCGKMLVPDEGTCEFFQDLSSGLSSVESLQTCEWNSSQGSGVDDDADSCLPSYVVSRTFIYAFLSTPHAESSTPRSAQTV